MTWVRRVLDVYWELRPCSETQALYKSKGLGPFEYWTYELKFLTQSTWNRDPSLPQYILNKYPGPKIRLDPEDQVALGNGFITDLGMNPPSFPIKIPL